MELSVIMAYYNEPELVQNILKELCRQTTDEVEIIVVDDGCNEPILDTFPVKVVHLPENSGGDSVPRNVGLDIAKGKYITFVDADDMVAPDYIPSILNKIHESEFEYCYFSWKGQLFSVTIKDEPPTWNCCVWNCIYSRKAIGTERFKAELVLAEDFDFNKRVRKGRKQILHKTLYYYNQENPKSLSKQGVSINEKYL